MFCPQCGKEVADDQVFCHHCGVRLRQEEQPVPIPDQATVSEGRPRTPWEDRESRGFFGGLFKTLSDVLFRPTEFFRKMPVTGGLTDPLLYALIVGMIGLMFSYLWQILMKGAMQSMMGMPSGASYFMFEGMGMAVLAFLSPLLLIAGLFVSAGILHVCLMLVKGSRSGFEGTFRVVSYGYSANVFWAIPFCGGILAGVWAIVLYIIGLREAHETTGGKAAFAVFLPVIVFCGLLFVALALLLGAAAGSLGLMMQH
jgi:hypothetical protein